MTVSNSTGEKSVKKTGGWRLAVEENPQGDLDAQIKELFAQLSSDLSIWRELASKFEIDVFCGVFMKTGNDGVDFSAATLRLLWERGARLDLDIYDASD